MNRIEAAIREGRCVLAIGKQALSNPDVLAELRHRSVPVVSLGGDPVSPVSALSEENLAAALNQKGGVLVLIEPDGASDGRALNTLGEFIKTAANKPKLFVAARAYNPFMMPMSMRLLKVEGLKYRAKDFVAALPMGGQAIADTEAQPKRQKKKKNELPFKAPRALFVGREEEVATLHSWLGEAGGPIVIAGPSGIGKRWLVEHALTNQEITRWPDLTFGPGVGVDTLVGRIADAAKAAGADALHQAVTRKNDRPGPAELATLVAETLEDSALSGNVFVIHGLDHLSDRRRGHFKADGRLEMVMSAILRSTPALRVILTATRPPQLYNEGAMAGLRMLELSGLKGKVLHEMFAAHHLEDVPREKFGPIHDRTMGHPMAARFLAISAVEDGDLDELLDQGRYLKVNDLERSEAVTRHIKRRIAKLKDADRRALAAASLFRDPATTDDLRVFDIDRRTRLFLVSQGLLDQTPVDGDRRYYVHSRVSRHLEYREVFDFDNMQALGRQMHNYAREAAKAEGQSTQALAYQVEGNRLLIESRRERHIKPPIYSDLDAMIENIRGMIRRKNPRLDIARQRINPILKQAPSHPELLLAQAELCAAEKADFSTVIGAYNALHSSAPTPEGYFSEADLHTRMRARGKAARALEHGLKAFPECARLYRRMATVFLDQNKIDEGVVMLKSAMTLEPLMPDTYGLLSDAYMAQGRPGWENALSALNEALALDPTNSRHLVRKASLLGDQGMASEDQGAALLEQADEAIKAALDLDKGSSAAQTLAACIIRDRGGDADQAEWFLEQSKKRNPTSFALVQKARVLIRKGTLDDVERLITKALKLEPSNHEAFAAQSEMWEGQGQIFHAFEAIKGAKERSHKDSAARVHYEKHMTRLGALIESGAAAEMMKAAGVEPITADGPASDTAGERRDPGTTTIRRPKKDKEPGAAEAAEAEEVAAEEVPVEPSKAASPNAEE